MHVSLFHSAWREAIAVGGTHGALDLSSTADRVMDQQITLRILNGARQAPCFAISLEPQELTFAVAFLNSRNPAAQANNPKE